MSVKNSLNAVKPLKFIEANKFKLQLTTLDVVAMANSVKVRSET